MMNLRDWRALVFWPSVAFSVLLGVLIFGEFDREIARTLFFSDIGRWLGTGAGDLWARGLIHTGGSWLIHIVGFGAFGGWLLSFVVMPLAGWRRELAYVFVGIAACTALVALLKMVTNVDCPWDLASFGGDRPYVTLFADRPDYLPRA